MRNLEHILEQKRGSVDKMEFDPTKNTEYDEEWAKIGKDEVVVDVVDDEDVGEDKPSKQTTLGGDE